MPKTTRLSSVKLHLLSLALRRAAEQWDSCNMKSHAKIAREMADEIERAENVEITR